MTIGLDVCVLFLLTILGFPVVPFYSFLGEGSPTKKTTEKKSRYHCANLSTGGPNISIDLLASAGFSYGNPRVRCLRVIVDLATLGISQASRGNATRCSRPLGCNWGQGWLSEWPGVNLSKSWRDVSSTPRTSGANCVDMCTFKHTDLSTYTRWTVELNFLCRLCQQITFGQSS